MAGRGSLTETCPIVNENIMCFKDSKWVKAVEPLHSDKPELAGIGPGMSFADYLQRKHGKTIGLIPCAFGGTALTQWQKGEMLYNNAVEQTKKAIETSRLKGILWHQGESDTHTAEDASLYKERFDAFIRNLSADLGAADIPIIIGELGDFLRGIPGHSFYKEVNNSLREIAGSDSSYGFVTVEGLSHKGDFLHFDSSSQRELGLRYARCFEECAQRLVISLD